MSVGIRLANSEDSAALHVLIRDHAVFERSAASLTLADLADLLSSGQSSVVLLVADDLDTLIGYAALTFDWSLWRARRYGHLDCLFVAEAARGRGIGRALLDAAVRIARNEGVDRLEWQTPAWNEDALRFYRRQRAQGFEKVRFTMTIKHAAR